MAAQGVGAARTVAVGVFRAARPDRRIPRACLNVGGEVYNLEFVGVLFCLFEGWGAVGQGLVSRKSRRVAGQGSFAGCARGERASGERISGERGASAP